MRTKASKARRGEWFQTFTGVKFFPLDPLPDEVYLGDIAHALARICRFGGHADLFYSVAEHSVFVADHCPPTHQLSGLMHDATEAYIGDMVSPLKHGMPDYCRAEARLWVAVATRYGLPAVPPPSVKRADRVALMTERRDLFDCSYRWSEELEAVKPDPRRIVPLSSREEAEDSFVDAFYQLCRKPGRHHHASTR